MKDDYIKVSDLLEFCEESERVSRKLYNKTLDQAVKGPSNNLTAAAYFDQQAIMYGYTIPSIIKQLEIFKKEKVRDMPIEATQLCRRTKNILIRNGIEDLGDLLEKYEFEILKIKGMSSTSLQEIKNQLKGMGLSLKGKVEEW